MKNNILIYFIFIFVLSFFFENKVKGQELQFNATEIQSLEKGNKIWFSISNNPKRKLKYTTEIIKVSNKLVGVNTHLTNKIILEALKHKKISKLKKYNTIKTEVKYNKNTRFDFLVSNTKEQCFVEVKNVTLSRKSGIAFLSSNMFCTMCVDPIINLITHDRVNAILFLIG